MSQYSNSAEISGTLEVAGTLSTPVDSLTFAPSKTISTDASTGNVFTVTLTGSGISTLANPTNLQNGAVYRWIVKQNGDGGSDILFGTSFKFSQGLPPAMNSASYSVDVIEGVSDGTYVHIFNHMTNITGSDKADVAEMPTVSAVTCSMWFDASDINTITKSGNSISNWNDKSGNAQHAEQDTADHRPQYEAAAINDLSIIKFDGVDQYFDIDETGATFEEKHVTYFFIGQVASGETLGHIMGGGSSATSYQLSYGQGLALNAGKPLLKSINASSGIALTGANSIANGNTILIVGKIRGSNSSLQVNGDSVGTDTSNSANPYTGYYASIGAGRGITAAGADAGTHADNFTGSIGELIVFTGGPLSDVETRSIEKYLVTKWGIVSSYKA